MIIIKEKQIIEWEHRLNKIEELFNDPKRAYIPINEIKLYFLESMEHVYKQGFRDGIENEKKMSEGLSDRMTA